MTAYTISEARLPASRIIGSGTILDTARLRTILGQYLKLAPQSIHAYVLGEHGDSEVLIWSNAEAGTLSLDEYAASVNKVLDDAKKAEIKDGVVNAAYKIIEGKGATFYGIAGALTQICRAINNNEYAILTVSSHHDDIEGVKGVSLSLPTVINKKGVFHVISPKLSDDERAKLKSSAEIMKEYTDKALAMIEENK